MDYFVFIYREETKRVYLYQIPDTELVNKGKRNAGKDAFWMAETSPDRNLWLVRHESLESWNRTNEMKWPEDLIGIVRNGKTNACVHLEKVHALEPGRSVLHYL